MATPGGRQKLPVINESSLYSLVLSRKGSNPRPLPLHCLLRTALPAAVNRLRRHSIARWGNDSLPPGKTPTLPVSFPILPVRWRFTTFGWGGKSPPQAGGHRNDDPDGGCRVSRPPARPAAHAVSVSLFQVVAGRLRRKHRKRAVNPSRRLQCTRRR